MVGVIHIKDKDKLIEYVAGMIKFKERQKFLENPIYDKVFEEYKKLKEDRKNGTKIHKESD